MISPFREARIGNVQVVVFEDSVDASKMAAARIAAAIETAKAARGRAVLGLATGSTQIRVYSELAAYHRVGQLSFRDVTTYNLDEYYPISPVNSLSYHYYMDEKFFWELLDLEPNRTHIPDGTVPEAFVDEYAASTTAGSRPRAGSTCSFWASVTMATSASTSRRT